MKKINLVKLYFYMYLLFSDDPVYKPNSESISCEKVAISMYLFSFFYSDYHKDSIDSFQTACEDNEHVSSVCLCSNCPEPAGSYCCQRFTTVKQECIDSFYSVILIISGTYGRPGCRMCDTNATFFKMMDQVGF